MLPVLADVLLHHTPPAWETLIVGPLRFLIYGILAPAVYLVIVIIGIELAWPGRTKVRRMLWQRTGRQSPSSGLNGDPTVPILCAVGGLIALAVWSAIVTTWLAGYLHAIPAPQLSVTHATKRSAAAFVAALVIGLGAGYAWLDGMRRASTARRCLAVLSISMSLAGTLLFFYALEASVRDILLALSLGIFGGELIVAARHPLLAREGLLAELVGASASQPAPEGAADWSADSDNAAEGVADHDEAHWAPQTPAPQTGGVGEEPAPQPQSSRTLIGATLPAQGQRTGADVPPPPAARPADDASAAGGASESTAHLDAHSPSPPI
jgi:hypothetical protein